MLVTGVVTVEVAVAVVEVADVAREVVVETVLGRFRFKYEYEIECEYDL